MIKKRPALAIGHSVAGLPAITSTLHSDERCELYTLGSPGVGATTLFLVRCLGDRPSKERRLADWWTAQPSQLLTLLQVLNSEQCPADSMGAVLALQGRRLNEKSLTEAKQGS